MGKRHDDFELREQTDLIRDYFAIADRYRLAAGQYGEETAELLLSLSDSLIQRAEALSTAASA